MRTWERNAAAVPWALAAYAKRFGTAWLADAPEALWHPPQRRENAGGNVGAVSPCGMHAGGIAICDEPLPPAIPDEPVPPIVPDEPPLLLLTFSEPELPAPELPEAALVDPSPFPFPPLEHPATNAIARSTLPIRRAEPSFDMGRSNLLKG